MEVQIISGIPGNHIDIRRIIDETVLETGFLPSFPIKQVKVITFPKEAVEQKAVIGNHYHPQESGRQEFYVIIGKPSEEEEKNSLPAFVFKFRKAGDQEFQEVVLNVGDACFIPPGYSHAFQPLRNQLCLIGVSNKSFSQEDDVPDKLS
jgi:quercetin dioxygenase-like cupin family protein